MLSYCGRFKLLQGQGLSLSLFKASRVCLFASCSSSSHSGVDHGSSNLVSDSSVLNGVSGTKFVANSMAYSRNSQQSLLQVAMLSIILYDLLDLCNRRLMTTNISGAQDSSASVTDVAPRIKFKRLDKTARHIMQIIDKEAVKEVKAQREIPEIEPGYIVQLKVEVPRNKRRVSLVKGIIIARRNAGLNTTIRIRRLVAGVGVESLYPLYSPNLKEIKVLDKKNVRRAKLYYLRDKMNALKK